MLVRFTHHFIKLSLGDFMKNFKYSIVCTLLVCVLSSGFAFTPRRIEPVDIRAEGMGGSYFTDSESFYILFSNPAGLAFMGEKTLRPTFVSYSSGMSSELNDLLFGMVFESLELDVLDVSSYDDVNLSSWEIFFTENFDYRAKFSMGPLTFGQIKDNSGWAVKQTMYFDIDGTSAVDVEYEAGGGYDLVFGYSIPIDLGFLGRLSFGFSGRGIAQLGFYFDSDSMDTESSSSDDIPFDVVLGFGFDVGVQYEVLSLINIAIVWQDAYSPVWIRQFSFNEDNSGSVEQSYLAQKLGIGIGLDVPFELITGNFISHFGIYANHNDLLSFFNKDNVCCNQVYSGHDFDCSQIVDLSIGTELVLFETIALRLGLYGLKPSAGVGIYLGNFRIDFSVSCEGLDSDSSFWTTGISMAVHY